MIFDLPPLGFVTAGGGLPDCGALFAFFLWLHRANGENPGLDITLRLAWDCWTAWKLQGAAAAYGFLEVAMGQKERPNGDHRFWSVFALTSRVCKGTFFDPWPSEFMLEGQWEHQTSFVKDVCFNPEMPMAGDVAVLHVGHFFGSRMPSAYGIPWCSHGGRDVLRCRGSMSFLEM